MFLFIWETQKVDHIQLGETWSITEDVWSEAIRQCETGLSGFSFLSYNKCSQVYRWGASWY